MTRDEFISNGVAWHGSATGWQSALGRELRVDTRTIRRAVADGPSERLAAAFRELLGDSAPVRVPAEWVCGDGSDGREYLMHLHHPRFFCLILTDDEYACFEQKQPSDYDAGGQWLCGIHWLDHRPDNLAHVMDKAADALGLFS